MLLIEGISINMSTLKSPTIIVGQFVGICFNVVCKIEIG
jgi:hypothetical protein